MKQLLNPSKIFKLILLMVLAISFNACKKLIEIPANPINQIPISRVFADSADVIAAISGVYQDFGLANSYGFASGGITIYTGMTADELTPAASDATDLPYFNNNIPATDGNIEAMWTQAYQTVFQINTCLEGVSSSSAVSTALKQQLLGELKVVRAFYYFNLINAWGGVPVVTGTDYTVNERMPRASTDSVYKLILADLTDAQKKLSPNYPSAGHIRPNVYVADALLAKVYLYLGQYSNAQTAASEVINSGTYSLTPGLDSVFLDGSTEAIWQLPTNSNFEATPEGAAFIPYDPTIVPDFSMTTTLLNAFEPNDQRKLQWTSSNVVVSGNVDSVYYYPYKYKNTQPTQLPLEDYMILRLADIYLVRAEALAQTGNLTAASADLNLIRARAGLPKSKANSQAAILSAIMHERQVELFCEWGNRWYDLKRSGTINQVLGAEKSGWKPADALFPIPVAELQSNSTLIQNPGY